MDEDEILKKLASPDSKNFAFSQLVRLHQEKIYWHIRKMVIDHDDADDLVQEVFIKVWNNIHKFRADSGIYTWIHRIATNECLGFLKKKRLRAMLSLSDVEHELSSKLDDQSHLTGDEIQLKLQRALLKLPDKQRAVFNMKYFEEMKYEDIAEITGTSVGGLKANYHHAVKKIEEILNAD